MKCNVLIITIDSLRADKCFGIKKTAETPNPTTRVKKEELRIARSAIPENIYAAPP